MGLWKNNIKMMEKALVPGRGKVPCQGLGAQEHM